MPYPIEKKLVIAVLTSALFDMDELREGTAICRECADEVD